MLCPGHLAQLRAILDDPEASANDELVAFDLLKNANIAAGNVLPMCQDTGTAIVMGKKGQQILPRYRGVRPQIAYRHHPRSGRRRSVQCGIACGRLAAVGLAGGKSPTIKANYLLLENIEVSGLQVSDYKKNAPAEVARCFGELFGLYETSELAPYVMTTYSLERCAEALQQVATARFAERSS